MVGIGVHLWLDPLDFKFDAIAAILDRLHRVAGSIVLLPPVLAHVIVITALVANVGHSGRKRLVPHKTDEGGVGRA